jgi:hypothetical protein
MGERLRFANSLGHIDDMAILPRRISSEAALLTKADGFP